MSRTSLFRPRRHRAVRDRPATGTRLLPTPHAPLDHSLGWGIPLALSKIRHGGSRVEACPEPRRRGSQERNGRGLLPNPPHFNPHYKRCPKAERLCLRSDQSLSRPPYGRSPDKSRHALSRGHCQVRAPLIRRIRFAPSGDAPEHGVIVLPWAIAPPWASAPFPDSPAAALAGESERVADSTERTRLKTNVTIFGFHRRHNRRTSDYEHRSRVPAPIPWDGRALLVDETAPHREFLGSCPHPLRSSGLSQSRRRCEPSAGADTTHRHRRRRSHAQPSGTFHPLPLLLSQHSGLFTPSFLRRQSLPLRRQGNLSPEAGPGRSLPP